MPIVRKYESLTVWIWTSLPLRGSLVSWPARNTVREKPPPMSGAKLASAADCTPATDAARSSIIRWNSRPLGSS